MLAPQAFSLAACCLAVLGIALIWPYLSLWGLEVELAFSSRRGNAGEPVEYELWIRNRGPFSAWGLLLEENRLLPNQGQLIYGTVDYVSGWSTLKQTRIWTPNVRGEYPQTLLHISTAFPFGLWKCRKPIRVKQTLLAWPQPLPLVCPDFSQGCKLSGLTANNHRPGASGERVGTREYRNGDSLRAVHWAQTAKQDRLIVSERQMVAQYVVELRVLRPESLIGLNDPRGDIGGGYTSFSGDSAYLLRKKRPVTH
ncbi:MAG: DUF58 domain-containing protein [Pirellulales bacterium]|nr:DUF58 domain-containing protein [Pirellulales bacterium]